MTCLSAYMHRQISKCTDKTPKKDYGGGGGETIAPCPPLATLVGQIICQKSILQVNFHKWPQMTLDRSMWPFCHSTKAWRSPKCICDGVADPGFVKREGRESNAAMPHQAWKSRSAGGGGGEGGGLRHIFFWRHLHYGVGVPSAYQTRPPGWKEENKIGRKKKKKKNRPKKGGGGDPPLVWPKLFVTRVLLVNFDMWSQMTFDLSMWLWTLKAWRSLSTLWPKFEHTCNI